MVRPEAHGTVTERPRCTVAGCSNRRVLKDYQNGKPRFRQFCSKHHWMRKGLKIPKGGGQWSNCEICGWHGLCHRHRNKPGPDGGQYVACNIRILCPNCHASCHGNGNENQVQNY